MKYYAAVGDEREIRSVCVIPPVRMLASYHYFKKKPGLIKSLIEKPYDILIDSGAFSAESSGKPIDIDEYCKFLLETGAITYAGLDVIGNAAATRENIRYMREEYGLRPFPTFHLGSTLEDLEKLMEYPYIALGGLVFSKDIIQFCDRVWDYILKNNPRLRVHGFGLTNLDLMARYPWYSVDSSSYKSCRRFGRQNILWDGFQFETIAEEEYQDLLIEMGYTHIWDGESVDAKGKRVLTISNNDKYHLYDFHSVQSYKLYAAHLGEVNKHKKFDYLTAQQSLF